MHQFAFCHPKLSPSQASRMRRQRKKTKAPWPHAWPNIAVEPTPNSVRSCVASAIGHGSPPALGLARRAAAAGGWSREEISP